MGTLEFALLGIEKYAKWARKVFLVTDNQMADFELSDDRIQIVDHKDFIPSEFLPTFNSNTIEMNFDLIEDLAERFVIFNDDTILIKPTYISDFFGVDGVPKDMGALDIFRPREQFDHITLNNLILINNLLPKKTLIKKNIKKYFSCVYGKQGLMGLAVVSGNTWTGWRNTHLPMAYTKSLFSKVYNRVPNLRENQSRRKFRTNEDVSHWLMRYYRLALGDFWPTNHNKLGLFATTELATLETTITNAINGEAKLLVLNDVPMDESEASQARIKIQRLFKPVYNG